MIRIVFIGSSIFSYIILKNLIKKNIYIPIIITQSTEYKKRGNTLYSSQVIDLAKKHNIKYYCPNNINTTIQLIKEINPTLIITASYGKIIPLSILHLAKNKCINIHASLLPKLRGSSPIQNSIINNNFYTGTTIINMNEKIDEGNIVQKNFIPIKYNDTYNTIIKKLAHLSSYMILNYIFLKKNNIINKQNVLFYTTTKKFNKIDGNINWKINALKVYNKINALILWPKSFSYINNIKIQILHHSFKIQKVLLINGSIIKINNQSLQIISERNIILANTIKLQNKNNISTKNINNIQNIKTNNIFYNN